MKNSVYSRENVNIQQKRLEYVQFFQELNLALNLTSSISIVPEPVDENLDVLSVFELSVVFTLLVLLVLDSGLEEVFVVASVALDFLRVQVKNLLGDLVQKASVVAHDQKCTLPCLD